MSRKMTNGWTCETCTFQHQFKAPRCTMCGELRGASRQQMRDFVAGKTLIRKPGSDDKDEIEIIEAPLFINEVPNKASAKPASAPTANNKENNRTAASSSTAIPTTNPFLRKNPTILTRTPLTNPYAQKKPLTNARTTTPAAPPPCRQPASTASKTVIQEAPATQEDPWQHASSVSAYAQHLHPSAPPKQSPRPRSTPRGPTTATKTPKQDSRNSGSAFLATGAPAKDSSESSHLSLATSKFPFVKPIAYRPGPVPHDPATCHNWVYPQHPKYPSRRYQLEISETAVHHNTLVSLPTGLGKTLIAAVVMYNYYRWFPKGKILFLAPTLPLVNQQVQACYQITGLPAAATAVLTGKLSKQKRMELWGNRRVFYCTPQTVQKDLVYVDSNGEEMPAQFANQVVCLVVDEAHKATGDYAYVKVVELLESAGAKFRIVGLSATLGTTIKAIQAVIQTLRSSRIEARHEMDPTVQPYLHQKHNEIVVVPRNDSQKRVEEMLNHMLTPILDQLRTVGALRMNCHFALKAFHILQARRDFETQNRGQPPGHVLGLFMAAQKLVEIRNDAHQSLGVVRTKLLRLRNDRPRGKLATLVKSSEFEDLVRMVCSATGMTGSLSQQQGACKNNPKLTKLSEILQEHFHRAQAVGKSSRVIVFAQFRDSVSEIVLMLRTLEPNIRPHHFVGQGKPPKGSVAKPKEMEQEEHIRLNGMKQSEQQKVIQEFRNDKYNVLVCTCIGEEGLDIGEVDLILNYECLRSPIRMIQRTGRTGRARAGRVVCLVSEGQEQRTFEQLKQAEKTLMRALDKKSNFIMNADVPLFPTPPKERLDLTMAISSQFHMSQVAGIKSGRASKTIGNSKKTSFKLGISEEQERQQRLGNLVTLDPNIIPWRTLRRVLIKHRSNQATHGGKTIKILKSIEGYGHTSDERSQTSKFRINADIYELFPAEKLPESDVDDGPPPIQPPHDNGINSASHPHSGTNTAGRNDTGSTGPHAAVQRDSSTATGDLLEERIPQETFHPGFNGSFEGRNTESQLPCDNRTTTSQASMEQIQNNLYKATGDDRTNIPTEPRSVPFEALMFRLPTPPPSSDESGSDTDCDEKKESSFVMSSEPGSNRAVELEARPGHSSHDDRDRGHSGQAARHNQPVKQNTVLDNIVHDKNRHHNNQNVVMEEPVDMKFCLPTQSPSSEDEGESDVDASRLHEAATPIAKFHSSDSMTSAGVCLPSDSLANKNDSEDDVPLISLRTPKKRTPKSQESPNSRQSASEHAIVTNKRTKVSNQKSKAASTPMEPQNPSAAGDPVVEAAVFLQGTPPRQNQSPQHVDSVMPRDNSETPLAPSPDEEFGSGVVHHSQRVSSALTDTPVKSEGQRAARSSSMAASMACRACFSEESLDEDPLILCDACNLAFHKSCYNINVRIDSTDLWYCDTCAAKDKNGVGARTCVLCKREDGALKCNGSGWCHPICEPFLSGSSLTSRECQGCSQDGGVRCFSCTASMHPYCAIAMPQPEKWTVVIMHPNNTAEVKVGALFCPKHVDNANTFISLHMKEDSTGSLPTLRLIQTLTIADSSNISVRQFRTLKRRKNFVSEGLGKAKSGSEAASGEGDAQLQRLERTKRLRRDASCFVLEEAEAGSASDSGDEDDEDLRRLEEDEMSNDSFINNATQLSQHYSQDNLAGVDPDASSQIDFHHRAIDAQREIENRFRTPLLNRRMNRPDTSQFSSSSQRGLGNLHFVRSVLDHHRNGGRAEEIEEYYRKVAREGSTPDQASPQSTTSQA